MNELIELKDVATEIKVAHNKVSGPVRARGTGRLG